jgi:hypothetical protein
MLILPAAPVWALYQLFFIISHNTIGLKEPPMIETFKYKFSESN